MAIFAPRSCQEGIWQYCNYGYDKERYTSFQDCYDKRIKECEQQNEQVKDGGYYRIQNQNKKDLLVAIVVLFAITTIIVLIYKNN